MRNYEPEVFTFDEVPGVAVLSAKSGRPWVDSDEEEVDGVVLDWWGGALLTHRPHIIQGARLALLFPRSGSIFDRAKQLAVPQWLRGRKRATGKWDFVMVTTPKLRGEAPRRAVAIATVGRGGRYIPVGLVAPRVGAGGLSAFLEDSAELLMEQGLETVPREPEWISWMTTGEVLDSGDPRLWQSGVFWRPDEF